MSENKPRISMIIPSYNVSHYLKRCLDSCLEQIYDNYEIICIDDGSTDRTGELLDMYANNNQDIIRVIHTKNRGVSEARNLGIRMSTGNFLWFIDPDDYISINILNDIATKLKDLDIMLLPYKEIREGGLDNKTEHTIEYKKPEVRPCNFKESISSCKFDKVWNYIVAKKVLVHNNLEFGTGIVLAEDFAFDFFLKEHISSWDVYNKVAYYYCIRSKSASKGHIQNDKNKRRMIENSFWGAVYFEKNIKRYEDAEFKRQAQRIQFNYVRSSINNSIKLGDIQYLKNIVKRLKEHTLYPYPSDQTTQSNHTLNNISSNLFNVPIIAETACVLYGLRKRFFL